MFETKISHNFTNESILKIDSKFNYNNLNSKISHEYKFYNHRGVLFYSKILDHDNGIIKDNFVVNCENTDRLSIKLLLINKEKYNIDLYTYNYIGIIYNDNINASLINTNENSISSNLGKIEENKGNISSNLGKIEENKGNISSNLISMSFNEDNIAINLSKIKELNQNKTYLKNLENILFYDKKTQVDFRNLFFEKIFEVNAKQNDFIEINFKMLLECKDISEKIMLILFMKFLMKIIIHCILVQ